MRPSKRVVKTRKLKCALNRCASNQNFSCKLKRYSTPCPKSKQPSPGWHVSTRSCFCLCPSNSTQLIPKKEVDLHCFQRGSSFSIGGNLGHTKGSILGRSMIRTTISPYKVLESFGEGAIRRDHRYVDQSFESSVIDSSPGYSCGSGWDCSNECLFPVILSGYSEEPEQA